MRRADVPGMLREHGFRVVEAALARARLEVQRRPAHVPPGRGSHLGALGQLAALGLRPRTVLDVGAALGTPWLYQAFPEADHVLMEPLAEFGPALRAVADKLPRAHLVPAAAGEVDGETTLHVHADLVGSSLLLEREDSDVNGVPRRVRQARVDTVVKELDLDGPYLIKADTQGSELQVLAGAETVVLPRTEAVLLEVSLFRFFDGGPVLADVVAAMGRYGFEVHDLLGQVYRPLDGALSQLDLLFVRQDGPYRSRHQYATAEQRRAQDTRLRAKVGRAGLGT